MAYSTRYTLTIENLGGGHIETTIGEMVPPKVRAQLVDPNIKIAFKTETVGSAKDILEHFKKATLQSGNIGKLVLGESIEWYDRDEDMKGYSTEFPLTVFKLEGLCEDGELWVGYYKDGKMQEADIEFIVEAYDSQSLI